MLAYWERFVSLFAKSPDESILTLSIQKHALTCLLCRYTTLGLKSVLRLPVHGIVIAMVYAWFTHYCVHIRMTWRTFLLNSYKLRILYALKEDKQGENSRHTHSLCETACRLWVHTQHTQRTPLVYTHTAPKTPTQTPGVESSPNHQKWACLLQKGIRLHTCDSVLDGDAKTIADGMRARDMLWDRL